MQMLMLLLLLLLLMLLQVRLHPGKVILVLLIAHQEVALLGTILASAQLLLLLLRLLGTPNGSPGIGLLRDGIVSWVSTKLNWPGGLVEALLATALIG